MLGGWNLGAGGCRGDVIGPEQEASEKQVSLFILILFAVPAGEGRGGGVYGSQPRQGLLGNGEGCQAGPTANIRSSHLCSQKPGVLPKASFRLHGMITLDVGQLLRACSLSLPPSLPLCSLPGLTLSLSLTLSFSTAFKSFPPNMQQLPWLQRMEHKKVSNESGLDPDVPHVYPFRKKTQDGNISP